MELKQDISRRTRQKLKHEDWRIRKEAVEHLRNTVSPVSSPILAQALRDENNFVGEAACRVMEHIGKPAIPYLLEALTDTRCRVRSWVVWTLGKIQDDRVVPDLIPLLNDSDDAVQSRAFQALGWFHDPRVIPALMDILKEDKHRRNAALETLTPFGILDLLPLCLEIIDREIPGEYEMDGSARLAAKAIAAMGDSGLSALLTLTQDKRIYVRKYAAEALGYFRSPTANFHLINLLKDEDPYVRMTAADALGWPANGEVVPFLLQLKDDPSHTVILALPEALGRTGDLSTIPFLMEGLRQERDNMDRGLTAQARAYWHFDWQNPDIAILQAAIEAFERSHDPRLRISAVWLLHYPLYSYHTLVENWLKTKKPLKHLDVPLNYTRTLDTLLNALADPVPDIRLSAIFTNYAGLRDPRVPRVLAGRLEDNNLLIAHKSAELLTRLRDKRTLPALLKAVERSDERLQATCLGAIGAIGQTKALPVILNRLAHPSARIRQAAGSALGAMNDPAVLETLVKQFQQEQVAWVRSGIVHSIVRLKTAKAVPFLVNVLSEKPERNEGDDGYWLESAREIAVMGLADLNAEEAVPELLRALDENANRGGMVHVLVNAIGRIGAENDRLDRLFKLLTHPSSYVRGEAATQLGYIGAKIQNLEMRDKLVQELIGILYDTGHALHYAVPLVGDSVAKSLYYVGTPEAHAAVERWRSNRAAIIAEAQKSNVSK